MTSPDSRVGYDPNEGPREEMQRGLLAEFYKEELLQDLLQESHDTIARRNDCKKMIEALEKADEIVSSA